MWFQNTYLCDASIPYFRILLHSPWRLSFIEIPTTFRQGCRCCNGKRGQLIVVGPGRMERKTTLVGGGWAKGWSPRGNEQGYDEESTCTNHIHHHHNYSQTTTTTTICIYEVFLVTKIAIFVVSCCVTSSWSTLFRVATFDERRTVKTDDVLLFTTVKGTAHRQVTFSIISCQKYVVSDMCQVSLACLVAKRSLKWQTVVGVSEYQIYS